VLARFAERGLAAAVIGSVSAGRDVAIVRRHEREVIWDFAASPLMGCAPLEATG
jgi:selenophosphate synthetase-related protein